MKPTHGSATSLRGNGRHGAGAPRGRGAAGSSGVATGGGQSSHGRADAGAGAGSSPAGSRADEATAQDSVTMGEINKYLRFHPMEDITTSAAVQELIQGFVDSNKDAATSPNLATEGADDTSCLAFQLSRSLMQRKAAETQLILEAFRILFRKEANRVSLADASFKPLIDALKMPLSMSCATEASNVVLNLCFEEANVDRFLDLGGMKPLVRFLSTPNAPLQASACGALQSVCYAARGRNLAREAGALPPLCELLSSDSAKVVVRAVGALHNLSSDPLAITIIRDAGGVLPLVALLRRPSSSICGSAAGAIQNLSREPSVRAMIAEADAVVPLTDLLVSADTTSQVCAAGALLNLLGPAVSDTEDPADPGRVALRRLLADGIALGAIAECLREPASGTAVVALKK